MRFLLILILFFSTLAEAKRLDYNITPVSIDCKIHKIYCRIVELQPHVDKEWARNFSDILYKESKKYTTDPLLTVAILMQESSLLGRMSETCGYIFKILNNKEVAEEACVYTDVGWFQFHVQTIKDLDLDPIRLKNDLEYATEWHIKLLKSKIELCKDLGDEAWSCYNSKTESIRKEYVEKVSRYLE